MLQLQTAQERDSSQMLRNAKWVVEHEKRLKQLEYIVFKQTENDESQLYC